MADMHDPETHGSGPNVQMYLVIFGALVVFTLVSFLANYLVQVGTIAKGTSFVIIMAVAIIKATLVAMYFMHLKFDWGKVYFIVIPVMVLCVMLMIILLPDIVLGWHQ
jgi:cytochrome c oxidase subunit 4